MVTTRVKLTMEFEQHTPHDWDMDKFKAMAGGRVEKILEREGMRVTVIEVEAVKEKT